MTKRTTSTCWRIAASLPLVFMMVGCSSVRPGISQEDQAEERAQVEIERRLNEVFAACAKKDFDRLEGYHLYGPKFTRFSGALPVRLDAATTRKLERDGLASLDRLQMEAEELKIDVFERTGIATFILRYRFDLAGRTESKADRTTLVFVKVRGGWRIAHEHLSPIINAEPGASPNAAPPHR